MKNGVLKIPPSPAIVPLSQTVPSGLSKSSPDYYKRIGEISAKKRKLTSEDFAAMSKKRKSFKGGRKKKNGSEVA